MIDPVELFLSELKPILNVVNEMLDAWKGDSCYQIPKLVEALSVKFDWDAEAARRHDPIIRAYLKNHPTWHVTRGAHGGIMRRAEFDKKEFAKAAKERAKQDIKAALAAKLALVTTSPATTDVADQDNDATISE